MQKVIKRSSPSSIDVARRAGVSQSAVSRAFKDGGSVSEATRRKVMRAAEELGYRPNELARIILSRRSNLIGVVMGEITNPFYPEVLESLLRAIEAEGYRVLLKHIGEHENADEAVEEILRYRVAGALITSSVISDVMADRCGKSEVPVVLFNRRVDSAKVCAVCCDSVEAGRLVADRFCEAGLTRFAFVSGSDTASTNLDRKKGFLDRLAERGYSEVRVAGGENAHAVGFAATNGILDADPEVEGIFCASDILAFGAIDALRARGKAVGRDVAVVGFDDVPAASWPAYALTTVRQPRNQMVREAVRILMARINGDRTRRISLLSGKLVERESARLALSVTGADTDIDVVAS